MGISFKIQNIGNILFNCLFIRYLTICENVCTDIYERLSKNMTPTNKKEEFEELDLPPTISLEETVCYLQEEVDVVENINILPRLSRQLKKLETSTKFSVRL